MNYKQIIVADEPMKEIINGDRDEPCYNYSIGNYHHIKKK